MNNNKTSYSIQELSEAINKGFKPTINLTFGNLKQLEKEVHTIMQLPNGYKDLYNRSVAVVEKSYSKLIDPNTNKVQKARCVYDIACYDSLCYLMITFFGNNELTNELKEWMPKFGRNWFLKSMNEIEKDYLTNMYWTFQADELYEKATMLERLPRVKELTIEVIEGHSLLIKRDGADAIIKRFDEMEVFTDGSTNKPNTLAQIFIDLSKSIDKKICLKANDPYAYAFGKGAKNGKDQSSKHISQLAKALDSIVETVDQELGGVATKRWFNVQDGTDKRWFPRFKFIPSRTAEERQMAQDVLNNTLSTMDVAEQMTEVHIQGGNMIKNKLARHITSEQIRKESKILDE